MLLYQIGTLPKFSHSTNRNNRRNKKAWNILRERNFQCSRNFSYSSKFIATDIDKEVLYKEVDRKRVKRRTWFSFNMHRENAAWHEWSKCLFEIWPFDF